MRVAQSKRSVHSLTRRVIVTVCGALCLVWFVLLAFELLMTRLGESNNPALLQFTTGLREALVDFDDPRLVGHVLQVISRVSQSQRQQAHLAVDVLLQVRDREDGRIVFRSHPDLLPGPLPTGYSKKILAGTLYHFYFEREGRWEITVGQTSIPTSWLLKQISHDMTRDLLVAFPLVVVPVWLAVWLGLRPLRQLANGISKRDPDDLAPVETLQQHEELKLLADAFNVQLARVTQLIARERAFVQDAAHEMRTPMAVIAVNAHAVANARTEEERAAAEVRLHSGLSRTSHLVEQLLALTRLDVSRPNEMAVRDVVSLVRDELATAAPAAVARGIDLALEAPDSLDAPVEFHALRSIVGNLVDNAVRYGCNGGRVVVTLAPVGGSWILSVADDGIGIPAADRDRVFERFYRGAHDETHGTGLGLAIVRAAAARLGGVVRITEGLNGRGCTFFVQFLRVSEGCSPYSDTSLNQSCNHVALKTT